MRSKVINFSQINLGKRDADPRSPDGFAVGGFQSVPPSRPVKGGGLGGYHGFKGFGGVHAIGNLNTHLLITYF